MGSLGKRGEGRVSWPERRSHAIALWQEEAKTEEDQGNCSAESKGKNGLRGRWEVRLDETAQVCGHVKEASLSEQKMRNKH